MDHPYPDMVDFLYKFGISYYKNNNKENQVIGYLVPAMPWEAEIFYQLSKTVFDDTEPDGEESGSTGVSEYSSCPSSILESSNFI